MSLENVDHDKWPDLTIDDVIAFLNRDRDWRRARADKSERQRGMCQMASYTLDRITAHKMGIRRITND